MESSLGHLSLPVKLKMSAVSLTFMRNDAMAELASDRPIDPAANSKRHGIRVLANRSMDPVVIIAGASFPVDLLDLSSAGTNMRHSVTQRVSTTDWPAADLRFLG